MKIDELLQSLSDEQVQYVLVGGLAVRLHGLWLGGIVGIHVFPFR